jgi:circadian clock protein KaiB
MPPWEAEQSRFATAARVRARSVAVAILPITGDTLSVAEADEAGERVLMRMYVASDSAPSVQARRQLAVLRERFGGQDWEVEVVDVFEQPRLAEADRILATPVLMRLFPTRRLSVIGDFGDLQAVANALDLQQEVAP